MRTDFHRFRWLSNQLPEATARRVLVVTGSRQTGKTTLARGRYGALRYLNLDAVEEREALRAVRTRAWASAVGNAILDEAQKEPSIFDKVKWAFDEKEIDFTLLLGSSRILLLDRVRETLAGRAFLYELWPLMASELRHAAESSPTPPLLHRLLSGPDAVDTILSAAPQVLLGEEEGARREALEHLEQWGGMPGLLPLGDTDRKAWLRSYQQTFLERDLADLARIGDLHPFRTLQRLCMLRSGQLLSFAELARDAGIAATTARRYIEYLRISYQAILLPPYARNLTSGVVKSPKLYWMDLGLLRHETQQWGPVTGAMFETLVVSEIQKWVSTTGVDARLSFYRTLSGLEVDLMMETPQGLIGAEIKNRETVTRSDGRALEAIAEKLGGEWRGGLVIHRGTDLAALSPERSIWAVPAHRLL